MKRKHGLNWTLTWKHISRWQSVLFTSKPGHSHKCPWRLFGTGKINIKKKGQWLNRIIYFTFTLSSLCIFILKGYYIKLLLFSQSNSIFCPLCYELLVIPVKLLKWQRRKIKMKKSKSVLLNNDCVFAFMKSNLLTSWLNLWI